MEFEELVANHFGESIATTANAMDELSLRVATAGAMMAHCLTLENKIVSCGSRGSATEAQRIARLLLNRFLRERPGLPAISLSAELSAVEDCSNYQQLENVYSKQLRALGQKGDVLIAIAAEEQAGEIAKAIVAAQAREMHVIALTGSSAGEELAGLLNESDIEIRVPSNSIARIQEVHLLVIHCLCDLIDSHLFGVDEI